MKVIRSVKALRRWRKQQLVEDATLGFVPTMGALHAGHQSLMKQARRSCTNVLVSIFVNPLQFSPTEDLDEYPRPRRADIAICRKEGVDAVFIPMRQEFYSADFQTFVQVHHLTKRWEGAQRSTHFQGVTTVITKLFHLVKPDRAYFGQKDYQQLCIVRQMVNDLNHDVQIVSCPTIREADGLALSSRNAYLSKPARQRAPLLYQALQAGKAAIEGGLTSVSRVKSLMRKTVTKDSRVTIDYLAVCHADTLEPLTRAQGNMVLLGAVRLGKVRLLDNLLVQASS